MVTLGVRVEEVFFVFASFQYSARYLYPLSQITIEPTGRFSLTFDEYLSRYIEFANFKGYTKIIQSSSLARTNLNLEVENFIFKQQYGLVISFGVFHFIKKQCWKKFIREAQENTIVGGIHIIQIFTDDIAPTPDIKPYAIGLAEDGEIKDLYEEWDIIQFISYTFEEEHPGVPLHKHASNKLVARKSKPPVEPVACSNPYKGLMLA